MIDLLPMISEDAGERFTPQDKRVLFLVASAILLVIVLVLLVTGLTRHRENRDVFRHDCTQLGGVPHDLGNQTLCLYKDQVIGRFG